MLAYRFVHSRAVRSCASRSLIYSLAMLPTSGSRGLASVSKEQMDRRTLEIVSAGLHYAHRYASVNVWSTLTS